MRHLAWVAALAAACLVAPVGAQQAGSQSGALPKVQLPQIINAGGQNVPAWGTVLIDSTGAEKGTASNPVVVTGGTGGTGGGAVTIADGASVTLGSKADAAATTTDATATTLMAQIKQANVLLAKLAAAAGDTTTASPVSQSGTWNVGLTGSLPSFASTQTFNVGTMPAITGTVGVSALPALPAGANLIGSITQPDVFASGTIASGTANAAYSVNVVNGAGVTGFTVTGLTASGGTLAIETTNDKGTTWTPANGLQGSTGLLFSTISADGQFRVNVGGRTGVRLRVATTGSGTINVTSNVSLASTEIAMSSPLPPGTNAIGSVDTVVKSLPVDRGALIGTTAMTVAPANAARRGWSIQVQGSSGACYVNTITTATADYHSLQVGAGGYVQSPDSNVSPAALSVICTVASTPVFFREW